MAEPPNADLTNPTFVPVCAIGASAGGVSALQTLFRLLPDDLGLAYVVVVHLAPDHPSAMHEIIGAATRMPVHQVSDGPTLRANCVYVIAPDRELVIDGDDVQSRPFTDPRGRRAPIDMFFRSVASGRGDGIAVVLTGAGSDGALGVRAIKEAGGIVMVQEPAEASFPSMPQNAIATGVADIVAPLARLAERIAEAAHSKEAVRSLDEDGAANDVRRIVTFLRTRTGHDFSGYKRSTVLRRISRRMQVCQIVALPDYLQHLRANPEEAKELLSDLLISVTMFFRDPATFITLTHRVIRPLLESRSAGDTDGELRAWVVGCATGEEAYSLAILLLEEAEQMKLRIPMQIFATDLDEGALATAREGRYPRSIEADVSGERLKRFFVDEGTHYRISQQVRDLVLFATHSVVREPPFMRLDLITCRNVLIYLERSLQQHVCAIFHYGLKPEGFLFLGTAETADTSQSHFASVDRDARIYRTIQSAEPVLPALLSTTIASTSRPSIPTSQTAASRFEAGEILGASHASALEASAPPSALVDAEHTVLHLSPTAGRFILLSAGPLTGRLPSIVRSELRLDLKLALDRVFETGQPTITRLIDVQIDGVVRRTSLHITPAPPKGGSAPRAIVYFLDNGPGRPVANEEPAPPLDELRHLHSELKVAQEAELAGRIRHESTVQELRASNEELQSLNEEYRSTAEELETSKEELQSINEELQTVNAELKSKLSIISAAHNDLQNLTAASEIGTLFLDADLRIRMFTPRVAEVINITEADVGRPITNFTHQFAYDGLEADVRQVLRDLLATDKEIRTINGRWFLVRVRTYRTTEGKVEGVVATFDDITERRAAEEVLSEEHRNTVILQNLGARSVTEDNIQAIYEDILTAAIEITRAKAGTVQMFDSEAEELVILATRGFSRRTEEHFHRIDASSKTSCGLALRNGNRSYFDFDAAGADISDRLHVEDGVLSAQSSPLVTRSGKPIGMVSTHWSDRGHQLSDREIRFLDLLSRQAADVIEQRRSGIALRESEAKYRSLFESMDEAYAVVEILRNDRGERYDFRFIEVNPAFLEHTSMPWPVGRTATDLLGTPNPRWTELYGQALDLNTPIRVEEEEPTLGRTFDLNIFPLDRANDRVAVLFSNVTDRKRAEIALRESEARFQKFAESSLDILWIRDAETLALEFVSAAAQNIYGVAPESLLGDPKPGIAMIVPEDREEVFANIERVRAGQSVVHDYRIQRPDGTFRWMRSAGFPLTNQSGQVEKIGGIASDVTEAKLAAEHQDVLLAELQHRVRNIMAIVRSITTRTADRAQTVQEYRDLMTGRLFALARVQALLTRAANVSVGVRDIVHDEVSAQAQHDAQYVLDGPDVKLSPKAAEVLTLAIHELATNALKYGALSVPNGKVTVRWNTFDRGERPWLGLDWSETGASLPPASPDQPRRRGFGSELIEGRIPYELEGRGKVTIEADGAHCRLELPLEEGTSVLQTSAPQQASVFGGALDMTREADLTGRHILVVEDEYYLATDAARALQGAGANVIGPVPTEDAARATLRDQRPDAVVLDINLGSGATFKLAEYLKDSGIPFVFVTGYDATAIPDEFKGIDCLEKPVHLRQIVTSISRLVRPVA